MLKYIESNIKNRPASQEETALYCFAGEALSAVQHLEDALSHSIVLKKEKKRTRAEADQLLEKHRSYTLGKAIKIAQKSKLYPEPLQQELMEFLHERNWFVHKSIAQSRDEWDQNMSKDKLFRRIKALAYQAHRLQVFIEEDLMSFCETNGRDMSGVRKEIEKHYGINVQNA